MSTFDDAYIDPFEAHFLREPVAGTAVQVLVIDHDAPGRAEVVGASIASLLSGLGHASEVTIEPVAEGGLARSIERGLARSQAPLVIVTDATELWTSEHLTPLLDAINRCDHAVGRRRVGLARWIGRWISTCFYRWIFGVPLLDVHCPCRIHRREKLEAIPLQSGSSFVDIEVIAKATFLGHLLDEMRVPPLASPRPRVAWSDVSLVFKHPTFVRPQESTPAEDAERHEEGHDGPRGEDQEHRSDLDHPCSFEDHGPKPVDQLREGEGLNERLERRGESVGGEEHPGEDPHREHDEVHQPTDRLGGGGAAGDQQADAGEGQRANDVDQNHEEQATADRHLK